MVLLAGLSTVGGVHHIYSKETGHSENSDIYRKKILSIMQRPYFGVMFFSSGGNSSPLTGCVFSPKRTLENDLCRTVENVMFIPFVLFLTKSLHQEYFSFWFIISFLRWVLE